MKRVVIDAYNFVGLRGGSGGSGSYVLSLIEHLARLIEVRVIASPDNARLFNTLGSRARRLTIHIGDAGHAASIRTATEDADLLYAPFTSLPDRASYAHLPAVTAIHDLQHRALTSFFPEPERVERDDAYFSAAADADGVMTFSQAERDNLNQTFNVPGPIGVVAHAPFLAEEIQRLGHADVPVDQNPYRAKFGRYVLYPAVNWPHKNHYRLVEAFRFLMQVYGLNDVKLILTGATCVEPRAHFYKTLLDRPWAKDCVVELGFVSNLQLFLLMQGAEVLAFPSMYEGFGIPVLESLRLGTPVIASNLPVMREWFGGCFQPFGDIRNSLMMAQDLYQLLTRPERRAALAKTGLERSRNFSSKRMAEETLGFFANIVDDSRLTRQRRTPRRDMAQLLTKKYCLVFHILIDDHETAAIGRIKSVIDTLRGKLGQTTVGFVFHLLAVGILACSALPPAVGSVEKPRGKGRRRAVADSLQRLVEAGAQRVQGYHEYVEQLAACATDINYVDDTAEGLVRAIHFYVSTQVDARYHSFVRAQQLDAMAVDEQLIERCSQQSLRQPPDEVDGYYVGSTPWNLVRDTLVQTAHESPWSLMDTARDDFVLASHELIVTDRTVRRQQADYFGKSAIIGLTLRGRIMLPKARFAYIETELKERVGHHFALASGLCELARTGDLEPIMGANIDAIIDGVSGEILVDPFFSSYSQAPEDHVTPTNFANELVAFLDRHKICASDYVYLHMPYSTLIAGVLQVVATSRVEDLPIFLIRICSIDESFRWHDIRQTSCVRAIAELGGDRRKRIRLFAESLPLQKYFEAAAGQTLPVLLNPVVRELVCAKLAAAERVRQRPTGGPLVFGYFGEARQEKGFHLLPGIVDGLLRRYGAGRIKFLLQVSSSPQNDTDPIRRARLELEGLAAADKFGASITLLGNFDDMSGYYGAIANCDALLMPYDPAAYRIRGSGVALEGLALGVPIVVTRDTDMASTFEGPGCIVASSFSAASVETACCLVVERYEAISRQLQDYIRTSPLILSESQFLRRLLSYAPEIPAGTPAERPVAIWIGNDVLSQGCSAVYQAQRSSLRRQGFEIYNVYVPYPDGGGFLPTDGAMEKYLVANSLGWRHDGYDFGCYAWWLNQSDDDQRRRTLRDIADDGGSTARLLQLNSYSVCPPSLLKLVENRKVDLVCLNYVHLLPVVEKLGLLRRRGTRVVLETHDIQAHQYAVRSGRSVDVEDKELEILRFSDVDAVVAISLAEYDEIRELNPWANVQLAIPTIQLDPTEWTPGVSHLTPDWLDVWSQRDDLQTTYDLRTPASLMCFLAWILIRGRLDYPDCSLHPGINGVALSPHPAFPNAPDGTSVPTMIGFTWDVRPDLRTKWPDATDPTHPDRSALLQWALDGGMQEVGLLPDGGLPPQSQELPTCSSALLEAFVLAHPTRLPESSFQSRLVNWLVKYGGIDVIIVGSDHPANLKSIEQFIEQVFRPCLEPEGVTVLLVGRSGDALQLDESATGRLLAIGEVASLDPLYAMASVVAVPTVTGSGTPIKVLDAFARGLCVSIPKFVDRALGLSALGFPMTDTPAEFGADILTLLRSPKARQDRIGLARRFAETRLSSATYDAKWAELAGLGPNKQPNEPRGEAVLKKAEFPASFPTAWVGSRAQENVDAD